MMKKKLFSNRFIYCTSILSLIIISGCSTPNKQQKIISLQKQRIQKLEKQLARQSTEIQKMKTNRWVSSAGDQEPILGLKNIENLMARKQWIQALKESSQLKKTHSRSLKLRAMRVQIFNEMGLRDQAAKEKLIYKKLQAMKAKDSTNR